jgi:acyl-coenzyme A thioesterase PaaI-like protein
MSHEDSVPRLNNLAESLGMEITDFSEGGCVVELTVREKHLNMGGMAIWETRPKRRGG